MPKRQFGKAIGARSARKLIRDIGGTPDSDLANEFERCVAPLARPDQEIVRLNDGRVLSISYGSANIYASADDFLRLLASVEERSRRRPTHPLGTEFPSGQGLIAAVPRLVQALPTKLHLTAQLLTGSVDSLQHIDDANRRLGGPECLDDPTILTPIVAYVGEVIRRATRGGWEIRPWDFPGADACDRWQPVIVGGNGEVYPTFAIFKELLESGSILARVGYDVAHRSE
jgi:hypothetical protein